MMARSWLAQECGQDVALRVVVAGPSREVADFIRCISGLTVLHGVTNGAQASHALRGRVGLPNGLVLELVGVSDGLSARLQAGRVIGQILLVGDDPDLHFLRSLWAALPVPAVVGLGASWPAGVDELAEHRVRAGLGLPGFTPVASYDTADRHSVRDVLLALLVAVLDLLEVSRARREVNG